MALTTQIVWLLVLAGPVACAAWTVTHEELFAEFHAWCVRQTRQRRGLAARKFFYVFTCEYCFSHYIAAGAVALTGFRLLVDGWTGLLLAHGRVVQRGRTVGMTECDVVDEAGRLIARATSTCMTLRGDAAAGR